MSNSKIRHRRLRRKLHAEYLWRLWEHADNEQDTSAFNLLATIGRPTRYTRRRHNR